MKPIWWVPSDYNRKLSVDIIVTAFRNWAEDLSDRTQA